MMIMNSPTTILSSETDGQNKSTTGAMPVGIGTKPMVGLRQWYRDNYVDKIITDLEDYDEHRYHRAGSNCAEMMHVLRRSATYVGGVA